MKKVKNISTTKGNNRGLFLKLSVFALFAIMSLFSGQTLAQTPTPTPSLPFCTPTTTLSESPVLPANNDGSFEAFSGPGFVTVDHVTGGTGLVMLTTVGPVINAVVAPIVFVPGTMSPVNVSFSVINPALPVDFTLRAASTFHDVLIRVRCAATCTPTTTLSESPVLPANNDGSFEAFSGPGFVTVDHVTGGTGLVMLTTVGPVINAVVAPIVFVPGTMSPVNVSFSVINPALPVDFTLRAASTFHDVLIRVRCPVPPTAEPEEDKDSN